jgi:hypothetical protein
MATSGVIYNLLHYFNLPVDIRNVCVMLAPGFSALTAWATYMYVVLFITWRRGAKILIMYDVLGSPAN